MSEKPNNEEPVSGTLKLTIEGDGVKIERQIPMVLLPVVLSVITGQAPTVTAARPSYTIPLGVGGRPSVAEYFQEKGPKTYSDIILVMARYAELYEGRTSWTKDDIRRLIKEARVSEPGNFTRDFGGALARPYIQTAEDDKSFHVTQTGLKVLEKPGPSKFLRGRAARKKLRRRVKRPKQD
jgi:hypothetical protein